MLLGCRGNSRGPTTLLSAQHTIELFQIFPKQCLCYWSTISRLPTVSFSPNRCEFVSMSSKMWLHWLHQSLPSCGHCLGQRPCVGIVPDLQALNAPAPKMRAPSHGLIYMSLYISTCVWYHIKTSLDSYLSLYLMHLCVYLYVGTIESSSGWVPPCKATRGWPGGEARESHHF